ncbi:MAG: cation diffusion facilitator family transporter [Thainema sp.]
MAESTSSKLSLYAAMAANIAIGIAKFIGAAISGSSAMLSEGVHSVVDSVNEVLLLYGLQRSQAEPDDDHPLGYGQELYFWSLIVAVLIFGLGGGISIYEGLHSLHEPELSRNPLVSYAVLAAAAVFEGTALLISLHEFKQSYPTKNQNLWRSLRKSKDPCAFVVIFEDFAALIGLAIAFTGVLVSQLTHNGLYDSIASIVIGLLLTGVAIVLVAETKGLLVGESASVEVQASIREIIQSDESVSQMGSPITLHLGPSDILLALNIEFNDGLSSDDIETAICRIEHTIRESHQEVKRIFIEAASVSSSSCN